jgi:hypothetical protein
MKRFKVLYDFIHFPVPGKVEYGRNTVIHMTGNTSFSNPDVLLSQITTACNNLETAYTASLGGGLQQTANLKLAVKTWDDLMRKQADYVNRISNGNDALMLSAGFHPTHQPVPALRPEFSAHHGEISGEVTLKHKAVKGAAWIWQYVNDPLPADDKSWLLAGVSLQAMFVVKGLTPGTRCWFRAACVTHAGQGAWSDPVSMIVS